MGVSSFGYLRINDCLRLLAAFRSLPRPSSAPSAKAFAPRPLYLDLSLILWLHNISLLLILTLSKFATTFLLNILIINVFSLFSYAIFKVLCFYSALFAFLHYF